jgi:synaptic vesicle membrane protein VAT-1
MRQIWITRAGPPEVLAVKTAPDPEPKGGEVRIRVEASGVNFADIMGRMGMYPDQPPIPVVPGYEVSGRVDVAGAGVEASWVGRDVIALTRFGGYADTICVPMQQVFARPADMTALEGAAIPVNYFTAWQVIVVMGALKRGETMLVHSALPRRKSPSISAPVSSAPPRRASTPNCTRSGSIISSTTAPKILRHARARSPMAAASS